jgi:hypothetical protein
LIQWRAAAQVVRHVAVATVAMSVAVTPVLGQGGPPNGNGKKAPLPLEAKRKATFTATEGTWISLDVSPDGQTIVFDLLGDLYTMPITGGKATRITEGMAFDAQPRFSPDGTGAAGTTSGSSDWMRPTRCR